MEIALDKTIKEFNMWNSMTRKPGKPAEGMIVRYTRALDEQRMAVTAAPGEVPEVDAAVDLADQLHPPGPGQHLQGLRESASGAGPGSHLR